MQNIPSFVRKRLTLCKKSYVIVHHTFWSPFQDQETGLEHPPQSSLDELVRFPYLSVELAARIV